MQYIMYLQFCGWTTL